MNTNLPSWVDKSKLNCVLFSIENLMSPTYFHIKVSTFRQSIGSASKQFRPLTEEHLWRPPVLWLLERRPHSVRPPSRPPRSRVLQPRFRGSLQTQISCIRSALTTLKSKPSNLEFLDTPWPAFNQTRGNSTSISEDNYEWRRHAITERDQWVLDSSRFHTYLNWTSSLHLFLNVSL